MVHFKKRLWQRYGICLDKEEILAIIDNIQNGRAIFVEKQSNRTSSWIVKIEQKNITIIYDRLRKTLVTAL
jgi:hypothetical protein